jgi:hypothetical protein
MNQRPRPPLWKFWPIVACAVFAGWELYEAQTQSRPVDWVLMGLLGLIVVFIIIVRGFMRV